MLFLLLIINFFHRSVELVPNDDFQVEIHLVETSASSESSHHFQHQRRLHLPQWSQIEGYSVIDKLKNLLNIQTPSRTHSTTTATTAATTAQDVHSVFGSLMQRFKLSARSPPISLPTQSSSSFTPILPSPHITTPIPLLDTPVTPESLRSKGNNEPVNSNNNNDSNISVNDNSNNGANNNHENELLPNDVIQTNSKDNNSNSISGVSDTISSSNAANDNDTNNNKVNGEHMEENDNHELEDNATGMNGVVSESDSMDDQSEKQTTSKKGKAPARRGKRRR